MKVAFIAGLSDKKLRQKLEPILILDEVDQIDLYRRKSYKGDKLHWKFVPPSLINKPLLGDIWRFLTLLMNGYKYDLIIGCHQKYHGVYACIAGFVWRKPVIQMIISEVDRINDNRIFRMAINSAAALTVRGENSLQRLQELGIHKPVTIIDNPFFMSESADNMPVAERKYDLVCVAGFIPLKGHAWLLEEVSQIVKQIPRLKLALVGNGPLEKTLREKVIMLGLTDHVDFLGWKDEEDLHEVYSNSKILVLCSWHEGLPMCVVEAMSFGLPVISTEVGELNQLVENGRHGILIKYGKQHDLVSAVSELLKNNSQMQSMGTAGQQRIQELQSNWTITSISLCWEDLLGKV